MIHKYSIVLFSLLIIIFSCQTKQSSNDQNTVNQIASDHSDLEKDTPEMRLIAFQRRMFEVDSFARASPKDLEADINLLAEYLAGQKFNDIEKARAVYTWLAENIRYDDKAYNSGRFGNGSAESTLKNRKSVCEGFANLFVALGEKMDLEIKKVSGFAKGFGYSTSLNMTRPNHAWNIINIEGEWKIFDATWGQGNGKAVKGKLVSTKEYDDYWFDIPPYEAIFNHYPENIEDAVIDYPISLNQYWELPKIEKLYFEYGFDAQSTFAVALENPSFETPVCFTIKNKKIAKQKNLAQEIIKIDAAPISKTIQLNTPIRIVCRAPKAKKMALIDAQNEFTILQKEADNFYINYTPNVVGPLRVAIQIASDGTKYDIVLGYEVAGIEG